MIVLAMTYHDPQGRLYGVMQTAVPRLAALFDGFAINASESAYEPTLALWQEGGADVQQRSSGVGRPPLLDRGDLTLAYRETEGLEFETAAAYADEVAAAGGEEAWKTSIDAEPRQWSYRLQAAQTEVEAIHAYLQWRDAA